MKYNAPKEVIIITGSSGFLAKKIIYTLHDTYDFIGIDIIEAINTNLLYSFVNSSSNPCFLKFLINFIESKKLQIKAIIHCASPQIIEFDDRIENILNHFETANIPIMLLQQFKQIVIGTESSRLNNVLPYKLAKHSQELLCKEVKATYLKYGAFGNNTHLNHLVEGDFEDTDLLVKKIKQVLNSSE